MPDATIPHLQLSFELAGLDPELAAAVAAACGATAVTFSDVRDSGTPVYHPAKSGLALRPSPPPLDKTPDFAGTPVVAPAPGEIPLWRPTRVQCLFAAPQDAAALKRVLAAALGIDPGSIAAHEIAERAWEREWLKDFHALRFGRRLWVSPHHERVEAPGAVVVALDPGLAFGTGAHASTALCLEWLDAHLPGTPKPAERVIDYGCGSGVLALAAVKLGARAAHCFDIDPQALIAARANAQANGIGARIHVHETAATLPTDVELLLANILAGPLCALASRFASLVRPGGALVLSGLMAPEVAEVTAAYAACFDVARFAERDGWVGLAGRRR
jgi:ribosomal protein L11 methyltransferase